MPSTMHAATSSARLARARLLLVSYRPLACIIGKNEFAEALTTFQASGPRRCRSGYDPRKRQAIERLYRRYWSDF